jgi:hypothetical protein
LALVRAELCRAQLDALSRPLRKDTPIDTGVWVVRAWRSCRGMARNLLVGAPRRFGRRTASDRAPRPD